MDHHVLKNEYGGGSLLDVGCYGLHFASWYLGNGFEEQIEHFCGCLRKGLSESPLIPHAQTLKIITLTDTIREMIGVRYPQDRP